MTGEIVTKKFLATDIPFDLKQTCKFLRIRQDSENFESVRTIIEDLSTLFIPKFNPEFRYKICRITEKHDRDFAISIEPKTIFTGRGIYRLLADCSFAACFIVTLGEVVDGIIEQLSVEDFTQAYFMDSIGSTVIHGLMKVLENDLIKQADELKVKLGRRFSPGYARWHLSEQKKLLNLLRAEEMGIRLSKSYYMLPRKSVSGVYAFV